MSSSLLYNVTWCPDVFLTLATKINNLLDEVRTLKQQVQEKESQLNFRIAGEFHSIHSPVTISFTRLTVKRINIGALH